MAAPFLLPRRRRCGRAAAVPDHVFGLGTFRAFGDIELYLLAFAERTVPIFLDLRIMHEDVPAAFVLEDEPVTFVLVKPFDFANLTQI